MRPLVGVWQIRGIPENTRRYRVGMRRWVRGRKIMGDSHIEKRGTAWGAGGMVGVVELE